MIQRKVLYRILLVSTIIIIVSLFAFQGISSHRKRVSSAKQNNTTVMIASKEAHERDGIVTVAHIGNSIQYYNDMPRLLEHMLQTRYKSVHQDSCLRGGASLSSLLQEGNGMATKFASRPDVSWLEEENRYDIGAPTVESLLLSSTKPWDFVIMNDHTQSPARLTKKRKSMEALRSTYIPMIRKQLNMHTVNSSVPTTTVIFIQTAAYRSPVKGSDDLGTFDEFTSKLQEGYAEYAELVRQENTSSNGNGSLPVEVAPVGLAYQYIKNNNGDEWWGKLYARDDFHPSPHGTFLEACLLYCTITKEYPPEHDVSWWKTARYMQPPDTEALPLPTGEEANLLREVAWKVCNQR
jgi:hypothetical protein